MAHFNIVWQGLYHRQWKRKRIECLKRCFISAPACFWLTVVCTGLDEIPPCWCYWACCPSTSLQRLSDQDNPFPYRMITFMYLFGSIPLFTRQLCPPLSFCYPMCELVFQQWHAAAFFFNSNKFTTNEGKFIYYTYTWCMLIRNSNGIWMLLAHVRPSFPSPPPPRPRP